MVMADLARAMHNTVSMDWMAISSYGSGTTSSGVVRILKDLDTDISGKHVLVVEDIVDSGLTLSYLVHNLQSRDPASVRVCVLLRKKAAAQMPVEVAYTGFEIADEFVIGYGLDYAEHYRNLPFIGTLAHTHSDPPVGLWARVGGARSRWAMGGGWGAKRAGNTSEVESRLDGVEAEHRARGFLNAAYVPVLASAVYRRYLASSTRGEGIPRMDARTYCAPAGRRRDTRLGRRYRPGSPGAVYRWI